jgi:hypothetical protein
LKRFVIALSLAAMGAAAANYCAHHISGPASGAVVTKQARNSAQTNKVSTYQLEGDYLSFSYPNSFTVSPEQALAPGVSQQNRLSQVRDGSQSLVLTVTNLPSGRLDDDPSYHMRTLHPETYALTQQTIGDNHLVIASRQDSFEKVAFWPHSNKLATIALSGTTANLTAANAAFSDILRSVSWR